jgi:putative addiction module killer protein
VTYRIQELLLADGDSPFGEWFRGIGEYKIDWGPGLRICLAKDGLKIIILIGGGSRKRQQHDIDQAVALWEDYKRPKASTPKGAQ